jgi:NarL family two-component system response regulator LiaR
VNVLIVDDRLQTRKSLQLLLNTVPGITSIRQASNGQEALLSVAQQPPDLVIMDERMPTMTGTEAAARMKAGWPKIKIILLSLYTTCEQAALQAGADLFISKGESPAYLIEAIDQFTKEIENVHR